MKDTHEFNQFLAKLRTKGKMQLMGLKVYQEEICPWLCSMFLLLKCCQNRRVQICSNNLPWWLTFIFILLDPATKFCNVVWRTRCQAGTWHDNHQCHMKWICWVFRSFVQKLCLISSTCRSGWSFTVQFWAAVLSFVQELAMATSIMRSCVEKISNSDQKLSEIW